jgi:iron complex transport system substrate-binding protein
MTINLFKRIGLAILACFFVISSRAEIITDDMGRKTDIILPVKSIISLSPAQTEIVYALGGGGKLRAVSVNCDYPVFALAKEKAGSFANPDIEKILKLNPDVVLANGEMQNKTIKMLEKLHINVMVFCPHNISGIQKDIQIIGKLLGNEKTAVQITADMDKTMPDLAQKKPVKVYLELWGNPAISIGSGAFLTDIISKAGGINILADAVSSYPKVSPEEVIKRNPDVILLLYAPGTGCMEKSWHNLTKAGRLGKIFEIEEKYMNIVLRPGPRTAEAIKIFRDILTEKKQIPKGE